MVTLRFSILAIFVTLFIFSMLILIAITHARFAQSIQHLSFNLMRQASSTAFHQIQNELNNAEIKSQSAAQLIKLGVIDAKNENELTAYTANLMQNEIGLFRSVQSIFWGDNSGNFVMAEKTGDGTVHSEIIERMKTPPYRKLIYRDAAGNIIRSTHSNDFSYEPRTQPWYLAAKKAAKSVWTDIYPYRSTGYLGISVATPVIQENGLLWGVVNLNVRLDSLQHLIEEIVISPNAVIFIVTIDGKLIAFPSLTPSRQNYFPNIHDLGSMPWIADSFDEYRKTYQSTFTFRHHNDEYMAAYQPLSIFGSHQWIIGIVVPADDFMGDLHKTRVITFIINLGILIFGITMVSILTSRVVRPLKKITREIRRIKNFDLINEKRIVSRIKEISYIADALYSMKKGLRTFQHYVPSTLVRQLIETGEDVRIGGVKKPLAILFSDIKDFTSITEQVDPEELTPHIYEYFDELSHIIVLNHGTIDKYIGDAIMAFWGAPQAIEQPALHAAKAALRCIACSDQLNKKWQAQNKPIFYTRMGIHLGEAIVGNLGSSERINYTAIGDATNIASRLEGINKIYGTQIIVSDAVYHEIKNDFVLRMLDCIAVKGKNEAHYIYELIAETREEIFYDLENYVAVFAKGYVAYQHKQWDEAMTFFVKCLQIYPEDVVSILFINRCKAFKLNPPAADWHGIWKLYEK